MNQLSIRRTEGHLRGVGRQWLLQRSWLPAPSRASGALPPRSERVVVLVHGLQEHSGRYEHVGSWLAARGCRVHAYDQRGHGRSSGPRIHARRWSDLLDDLDCVLAAVREESAGLPLFLLGHSMGGLVVASFLCERRPALAGAVTSAAALALPEDATPGKRRAVAILRWLLPRLAFPSGIDPEQLSRDPAVVEAYRRDPLVHGKLTLGLAAELFAAIERTAAGASEVAVPMLLLHGESDRICPPYGSSRFRDGLRVPGSALKTYPGLRHEILNEPERDAVLEDILDWMRKLPNEGPPPVPPA